MKVFRLNNGNLRVPARAEDDGIIGDGMVEIAPEDADYQSWTNYLQNHPEDIVQMPSTGNPILDEHVNG